MFWANGYMYKATPIPEAQETLKKMNFKNDFKSQKISMSAVRSFLLEMTGKLHPYLNNMVV